MKQKGPFVLSAASVGRAHTVLASTAFITALLVGCYCHYFKIVKNGVAGYPDEWFPSVSATYIFIYPLIFLVDLNLTALATGIQNEIFFKSSLPLHLVCACSPLRSHDKRSNHYYIGPRFALVFFQYYLHRSAGSLSTIVFIFGIIRTLSCGGWVYITSNDDHDVHDIMMITYMVCNIPWMVGGILSTPTSTVRRKRCAFGFIMLTTMYWLCSNGVALGLRQRTTYLTRRPSIHECVIADFLRPWYLSYISSSNTKFIGYLEVVSVISLGLSS